MSKDTTVVKEGFDFGNTSVPKNGSYLQPGQYRLFISKAEFVKPTETKNDGTPKTPYVEVTFEGDAGQMSEKFYVTPKAIDRLQYLHFAWFDKKLEKVFENADQVGTYFQKVLPMKGKEIVKSMTVGGKQGSDGKIYASLSYSGFVLPDEMNIIEGPFEPNSLNYLNNVKMNVPSAVASASDDAMLPDTDMPVHKDGGADYSDDLPF